jgi:FkbM family methyltransferase
MITALNLALSDRNGLNLIHVPVFSLGTSFNQLADYTRQRTEQIPRSFKQGIFSYTLDSFTEMFPDPFPNHIKIDVDGIQAKIIAGASRTLENSNVQSILIELDQKLAADQEAIQFLLSKGFEIASRTAKIERGVFNYIFRRHPLNDD